MDAIEAERQRLAGEIIAEMESREIRVDADRSFRMGLAVASRIVKRGRRFTEQEKFTNLMKATADAESENIDAGGE